MSDVILPKLAAIFLAATLNFSAHADELSHSLTEDTHEKHKNILGLFVGITGNVRRNRSPAIGIEYECYKTVSRMTMLLTRFLSITTKFLNLIGRLNYSNHV